MENPNNCINYLLEKLKKLNMSSEKIIKSKPINEVNIKQVLARIEECEKKMKANNSFDNIQELIAKYQQVRS